MWFVGGGAAVTDTTLRFDDDRDVDIRQYAVTASAGYATPSKWSFRGSLGAVLDGRLDAGGAAHDIGPGFVLAAGIAKQLDRGPWFLTGSVGAAVSRVTTRASGEARHSLVGVDIARLGIMAGRRIGIASPYLAARAFGGPVLWSLDGMDVTGTDTSKFQLGAGTSVSVRGIAILVDISALGERSISLGASYQL